MTKPAPNAADDWSNYWQTRAQDGERQAGGGEAFLGEGVETDARLSDYWRPFFQTCPDQASVLDIGCGAGSVLRHAAAASLVNLTGLDFSAAAIAALSENVPQATGITGDVTDPPFGEARFAVITSQFGIEYAGLEAFAKIAPFLAPGGQLNMLCHLKGGAIYAEVEGHLQNIQKIHDTDYLGRAQALVRANFARRENKTGEASQNAMTLDDTYTKAGQDFVIAKNNLAALIEDGVTGLSEHLFHGFEQLYARQQAYLLSDITDWLAGIGHELDRYQGRMQGMQAAALTKADIELVKQHLAAAGLDAIDMTEFSLPGDDAPIAWAIRATRAG